MKNKTKKIIFSFMLLIFSASFVPTHSANAWVAWPDIGNAFFRTMLDNIGIQVRAAIVGALKKAAIDTLTETVNNLVSGVTQAGSLFITDWEDYLFNTPSGNTASYMNDFFTVTARGRASGSYGAGACGSSFTEWRSERAKQYVMEIDFTAWQDDFQELACTPLEMFDDGTWAAYNAFMEPNNNPIAYALMTESVYEEELRKEELKASTQAIAYGGFKAQFGEDGAVITPGGIIEGITLAANTMDNDAIANAENAGEIAGIVVGKIASGVIKNGIGNARAKVQGEINNGICDASQELRDGLKNLTPSGHLLNGGGMGTMGRSGSKTCKLK